MSPSQRPTNYIVVQHGMPYTANEMPPTFDSLTRLDVLRRVWELEHVFDEASHYSYRVEDVPPISGVATFLAHTIYNPRIPIRSEWRRVGCYSPQSLAAAVEKGLQSDDDIIQQWFDAGQILELLNAAQSWSDMLLAVEAVGGSHEVYPDVQQYVESVLGKEA